MYFFWGGVITFVNNFYICFMVNRECEERVCFKQFLFEVHFIDYAITVVPFFLPLYPPPPCIPHLSSCPWVVHIRSLASPFPILFLTSPCTYQLCFLFPVPFLPFSPLLLPADNPPCDLHFCNSVPVLVVCLVCFCFCFFGSAVDSCEFVVMACCFSTTRSDIPLGHHKDVLMW